MTTEEMIIIKEFALAAMQHSCTYGLMAMKLDLSDDYLEAIEKKLVADLYPKAEVTE
jgi:hypothetical protein